MYLSVMYVCQLYAVLTVSQVHMMLRHCCRGPDLACILFNASVMTLTAHQAWNIGNRHTVQSAPQPRVSYIAWLSCHTPCRGRLLCLYIQYPSCKNGGNNLIFPSSHPPQPQPSICPVLLQVTHGMVSSTRCLSSSGLQC